MSQTKISNEDSSLLAALEQNEFDIAGLAEFCAEAPCIDRCLRQLYSIIKRHREPNLQDRTLLAQVLFGMVAVARNDYAADGHQEYWPFLFGRIRDAVFADPEKFWTDALAGQQSQSLLGRWFRMALDALGYSIPDEGQTYVGPIVFHSGMPFASLPGVLEVIATACDHYGPQVVTLPADIRSGLVANHVLHRNVERLLTSNLQGAAQLWGCLARVVLAWKTLGDCSDELQQLPLALDPEEVRAALPTGTTSTNASRAALPQLRYDSETGEIRLSFPDATGSKWNVTSNGSQVDLVWARTHVGRTAEFCGPLPEQILVEPRDTETSFARTFCPQPLEWPGYWFHAQNGNIEDGRTIDASGLESGRWYVVFEGTPTKCSVPFVAQIQLKWSWFKGHSDWTAWEIDVPARTKEHTHLEWFIDDNCFRVPLARRPGPRVEFLDEPSTKAFTPDGSQLEVFDSAPTVSLTRESAISVQLLRETKNSVAVVERLELKPEKPTRLPVSQPGVYQLRESRGVGRILLHFAVVPGFQVQGPSFDVIRSNVSITLSAVEQSGYVRCEEDRQVFLDRHAWTIQSSTTEPFVKALWCWSAEDIPILEFHWPVEALRWRLTQAEGTCVGWTREPVFISPKTVDKNDTQLEVQLPIGSDLTINGVLYADKVQNTPSGSAIVLSLFSYGDSVELSYEGRRYAAVIQSERPLLDAIDGVADSDSLIVSWQSSSIQPETVVVAWDPFDVSTAPKTFALTDDELQSGEWEKSCTELPGIEWTAISLARSVGGFFQHVLHLAASRSESMDPISLLLDRSTGTLAKYGSESTTWAKFLHDVSLIRLYGGDVTVEEFSWRLDALNRSSGVNVEGALTLAADLQRLLDEEKINDRDRRWAEALKLSVIKMLDCLVRENPAHALSQGGSSTLCLNALLNLSIPVGQAYPFRWVANCEPVPENSVYPFAYIRDLWLLGTGRMFLQSQLGTVGASIPNNYDELQENAARDVLQFHQQFSLPPLSAFLPLGSRTATVESTDRGHSHSFALPPIPDSFLTAADLCETLGLQDKSVDCQATCDDQFFADNNRTTPLRNTRGHSPEHSSNPKGSYSLYWCSDENRWAIENLSASPPTCCFTNGQPLVVDPIRPNELANHVMLNVLNVWSTLEDTPSGAEKEFGFLAEFRDRLVSDKVSGSLHVELFKPPEKETKELFGRIIEVETKPGLPEVAIIAWQLAWIERVTAWEGAVHLFERSSKNRYVQERFLRGLARAIELWPNLMRRCIALAELVYWTLYRGGLGASVRFHGAETDNQLATLHVASSTQQPIGQNSKSTTPSEDCITNISGVILGYNAGIGIVLLQHRSSPSIDFTLRDYLKNQSSERNWFASFLWGSLTVEDRQRIQQQFSERKQGKRDIQYSTLADVMCGLRVTCDLTKNPKWEATSLKVSFGLDQLKIPKYQRKQPH